MPERWTDEAPSAILDKRAFMPFGTGVYGCAGQKLAMLEMRSVVANLVRTFDIGFGEGTDDKGCEEDSRDCFTLAFPPNLLFKESHTIFDVRLSRICSNVTLSIA